MNAALPESRYDVTIHDRNPFLSLFLRAAQLDLIHSKEGDLSHPYYWAGFALYGDWR